MNLILGSFEVSQVELFNTKRMLNSATSDEKIQRLFQRFFSARFRCGKLCLYRDPNTKGVPPILMLEIEKNKGFLIPRTFLAQQQ